jgi:hypothetical protein
VALQTKNCHLCLVNIGMGATYVVLCSLHCIKPSSQLCTGFWGHPLLLSIQKQL